jgi:hypothetical protein
LQKKYFGGLPSGVAQSGFNQSGFLRFNDKTRCFGDPQNRVLL